MKSTYCALTNDVFRGWRANDEWNCWTISKVGCHCWFLTAGLQESVFTAGLSLGEATKAAWTLSLITTAVTGESSVGGQGHSLILLTWPNNKYNRYNFLLDRCCHAYFPDVGFLKASASSSSLSSHRNWLLFIISRLKTILSLLHLYKVTPEPALYSQRVATHRDNWHRSRVDLCCCNVWQSHLVQRGFGAARGLHSDRCTRYFTSWTVVI